MGVCFNLLSNSPFSLMLDLFGFVGESYGDF